MINLKQVKEAGFLKNYCNLITKVYNAKLERSSFKQHIVVFKYDSIQDPNYPIFKAKKCAWSSTEFTNKIEALKFINLINN